MIHGVNLHNVVRSAITAIHPDENCILYHSIGQRNVKGKVVPVYAEPINIKANFQPLDTEALKHVEALSVTGVDEQVFLYPLLDSRESLHELEISFSVVKHTGL